MRRPGVPARSEAGRGIIGPPYGVRARAPGLGGCASSTYRDWWIIDAAPSHAYLLGGGGSAPQIAPSDVMNLT